MPKLKNLTVLPVKDQIIICVTDALTLTNRYLEPFPRFSRSGKLIHIECSSKQPTHTHPFKLVIHYNENGNISFIGDQIAVDTSSGEINYEYVHAELVKLFRTCFSPQVYTEKSTRI